MHSLRRCARVAYLGSAAVLVALPSYAWAQTVEETTAEAQQQAPAPEATTAANDEGQDTATGDIVVTARRTEERLQRVPSSVSAFNERALDRIQATDTTGLQGAVPNLNIVQGRGSSNATNIYHSRRRPARRAADLRPGGRRLCRRCLQSRIRGTQLDLFDLERVEVLRGPQGTLYGKNTIGGALKVVTRKPGQEIHASGSIAYGTYNQRELQAQRVRPDQRTVAIGAALSSGPSATAIVEDEVLDRDYNDKNTDGGARRDRLYAVLDRPGRSRRPTTARTTRISPSASR